MAVAVLRDGVPGAIAAVADGHGGRRYVRSDVGADLAVQVACETTQAWWAALGAVDDGKVLSSAVARLVPTLVRTWRVRVADDVARRPFTVEEEEQAGTPLHDDPLLAYGATLLLAVATDRQVLLAQLGDGDMVVATAEGRVLSPVPGDERLVAGQTTSLGLAGAERDFRTALVPASERPHLVLLSSDGYGNSFADAGWRVAVTRDLQEGLRRDGVDRVAEQLPAWLSESAEAAGDDVSVAVLIRRSPRRPPTGPDDPIRPPL